MATIEKRLDDLERISDPPALKPLHILCSHWTEPIDDTPIKGGPMVVYHQCQKCQAGKVKDTKIELRL